MRVINECRVYFQYRASPQSALIINTVLSNAVSTDIVKNILNIDKYVDKKCTYAFDILKYTIVISNISNSIVKNIFLKDKIPDGTRFIENSITVNNIKKRNINPESGFYIGSINPQCSIKITFRVVVLVQHFYKEIKNYSIVEHDYIYNVDKPPTRIPIKSNEIYTEIESKVFKQISVDNIFKIHKPMHNIIDCKININILETKLTNSVYGNGNSNLCTLIVIGIIKYEIEYNIIPINKSNKFNCLKINKFNDISGFSCFMLVPPGIEYEKKDNIKLLIEDICTKKIDENTIFISTNLLLYY